MDEERIGQRIKELTAFLKAEAEAVGPEFGAVILRVSEALAGDSMPTIEDMGLVTVHMLSVRAREVQQSVRRDQVIEADIQQRLAGLRSEFERREAQLRAELRAQYAQRETELRAQLVVAQRHQGPGFRGAPAPAQPRPAAVQGRFHEALPAVPPAAQAAVEQHFHENGRTVSRRDGRRVVIFGGGS